jgi:hypothetical protein
MLRAYVAPVMAEAGFARWGRIYHATGPRGDRVFLEFMNIAYGDGATVFLVRLGAAPLPYRGWLRRADPESLDGPGSELDGLSALLVHGDVPAPREHAHRIVFDGEKDDAWVAEGEDDGTVAREWAFRDDAEAAACGGALAALLRDGYVPLMRRMLDRRALLDVALDPAETRVRARTSEARTRLFLTVDDLSAEGLDLALAAVPPEQPARAELVAWARARVAAGHAG